MKWNGATWPPPNDYKSPLLRNGMVLHGFYLTIRSHRYTVPVEAPAFQHTTPPLLLSQKIFTTETPLTTESPIGRLIKQSY
jgi:hypothetical protein